MSRTTPFMESSSIQLLRVFIPFAMGYFLFYLYRTVNAVIASDLVVDVGLGPASLGLFTATSFITFAAFQIPLGMLLDRFGLILAIQVMALLWFIIARFLLQGKEIEYHEKKRWLYKGLP